MDDIDRASLYEQQHREHALAAQFRVAAVNHHGICVLCSERIPNARMRANPAAIRCIECQIFVEARHGTT